jgi:hypothetical protein
MIKSKRESVVLAKEAAALLREAKKDKSKMELAVLRREQADAAYARFRFDA